MGVIDCHIHLYPPEVNCAPAAWATAQGEAHWKLLCARTRKNGRAVQGFPSIEQLLRAMDAAGVERAILQGWYWEKHDTCAAQNRFYARCLRSHRDRLSACATFHPAAGASVVAAELRWVHDNGFCGLGELSPHSQLYSVDDRVWRAALEQAGDLKLPVLLHVTEPQGGAYPGRVLTPIADFVRLAQEHPQTTFVLAHWGARLPFDMALGPVARSLRNIYYDTAASPLLYDFTVFSEMVKAVGADRVLFGSDYPLNLFPAEEMEPDIAAFLEKTRANGFSHLDHPVVFRENARRVFKLS